MGTVGRKGMLQPSTASPDGAVQRAAAQYNAPQPSTTRCNPVQRRGDVLRRDAVAGRAASRAYCLPTYLAHVHVGHAHEHEERAVAQPRYRRVEGRQLVPPSLRAVDYASHAECIAV